MKKAFLLPVAAVMLLGGTACSGDKAVKEWAERFGQAAAADNLETVRACYPGAEAADSVALNFSPDSVTVAKSDSGYTISYGSNVTVDVKKLENDSIEVVSSHGLFAYPQADLKFAESTGALKDVATDARLAAVMNRMPAFRAYLYSQYKDAMRNAIKVSGPTITKDIMFMMDEGKGYYTLKNTTDKMISGSEYEVVWLNESLYAGGGGSSTKVTPGKDIAANGTVTLPFSFSGHSGSSVKSVRMKDVPMSQFMADYKGNGTEYAEYCKTFPETEAKANKKGGLSGNVVLSGTIGSKNRIHMNLDMASNTGTYYYDKYGPKNTLDLVIKIYDPTTGKVQIEETNKDGLVTGTFEGTLTGEGFDGNMTAYTGKTFATKLVIAD